MRGLLDVTDTLVGGKVVPPPDVVRHDEDDPYLVVAADKGTATSRTSRTAIAIDYGFWLGDAFASGGSTGYDHKADGDHGPGAWESVKRHFRELGTRHSRPQTSPWSGSATCRATCSATACSSPGTSSWSAPSITGTSSSIRTPIQQQSFDERPRLFAAAGLLLGRLRRRLISAGGGVFPRTAKSIPLSPEARAVARHRRRRRSRRTSSSAPCSEPRSTCSGTAASART